MSAAAQPRPDPVLELVSVLETLSTEAEEAAISKCKELGLPLDRGTVPLDESFINLRAARALLLDAAKSRKLSQLPLSAQSNLTTIAREISRALTGLINGSDEVVNLSQAIEQLHVAMWQFRLDNLSPEFLGYQTKLNELKRLEREIGDLRDQLKGGITSRKRLETIVDQSEQSLKKLEENVTVASESAKKIAGFLQQSQELEQSIGALHKTAVQHDVNIVSLASSSKTATAEVTAREQKVREFFEQIAKFRKDMQDAQELQIETASKWQREAENRIAESQEEKTAIISELKRLEGEIQSHLQKAVGASLFHAFAQRQNALATSKQNWFLRLAGAVVLSFMLGTALVFDLKADGISFTPLFFLKLSLSLPLIFAISFCAIQYSRERRLEEEYAFKANISVSLIAYKELVEKLVEHENEAERQKFTDFVISSIQEIFRSPLAASGAEKKTELPVEKVAETVLSGAAEIVKAAKK